MTKTEIQQVKQRFGIIGNTEALLRAIDVAIQVAPTDLSVLIPEKAELERKVFRKSFINTAGGSTDSISLSTVERSPKGRSTRNCSAMRKEHLPVRLVNGKDISVKRTAVRFSWMK